MEIREAKLRKIVEEVLNTKMDQDEADELVEEIMQRAADEAEEE